MKIKTLKFWKIFRKSQRNFQHYVKKTETQAKIFSYRKESSTEILKAFTSDIFKIKSLT